MPGESSDNIKVCVRVRPFIIEELEGTRGGPDGPELCIDMPGRTSVTIVNKKGNRHDFEFDRCFWSHSEDHPCYATQETIQDELGNDMLEQAMNGFNNCIFAYGQTGSGKSYSVLGGSGDDRGILPRVVEGLFNHFQRTGEGVRCHAIVSFMEIYNEQIHDLLTATKNYSERSLMIRQHPILGTIIAGLTEAAVEDEREVMELIEYGIKLRHVGETWMNAESSRSHCIFTFKTKVENKKTGAIKMSQTNLVDLAGSERANRSGTSGLRLREGATINQSLSTLARVIQALASSSRSEKPPFRDSKLTYLLKESLSGNSKTVMMAAISPSLADYEETKCTLKFAQSVKQIRTHVKCNLDNQKSLEFQLRQELDELKLKLQEFESTKMQDSVMLAEARQKLQDQESLCQFYGQDWETLLAIERRRRQRRMSIQRGLVSPHAVNMCSPEETAAFFAQIQQIAQDVSSDSGLSSHIETPNQTPRDHPSMSPGAANGGFFNFNSKPKILSDGSCSPSGSSSPQMPTLQLDPDTPNLHFHIPDDEDITGEDERDAMSAIGGHGEERSGTGSERTLVAASDTVVDEDMYDVSHQHSYRGSIKKGVFTSPCNSGDESYRRASIATYDSSKLDSFRSNGYVDRSAIPGESDSVDRRSGGVSSSRVVSERDAAPPRRSADLEVRTLRAALDAAQAELAATKRCLKMEQAAAAEAKRTLRKALDELAELKESYQSNGGFGGTFGSEFGGSNGTRATLRASGGLPAKVASNNKTHAANLATIVACSFSDAVSALDAASSVLEDLGPAPTCTVSKLARGRGGIVSGRGVIGRRLDRRNTTVLQ